MLIPNAPIFFNIGLMICLAIVGWLIILGFVAPLAPAGSPVARFVEWQVDTEGPIAWLLGIMMMAAAASALVAILVGIGRLLLIGVGAL